MKKIEIRKLLSIFLVAVCASIIAGIYGILNDQFTFTISHEYYTKFKFIQFNILNENDVPRFKNLRFFVAIVGFLATWWFGLILGIIIGIFSFFIYKDWKTMFFISMKSIFIAIIVTFTIGIFGLIYGKFILVNKPISDFNNWYIPNNLSDFKSFIVVGSMHNFSYIGGVIGLLFALFYLFKKRI